MKKAPTAKVPTGAILTRHLKMLAHEIETTNAKGDIVTKAEALAALIWKYALGFEEEDPDNKDLKIRRRPEQWAIYLVYERLEGRTPMAEADDAHKGTAAQKVTDLGVAAINTFSDAADASPSVSVDVDRPVDGSEGAERPSDES